MEQRREMEEKGKEIDRGGEEGGRCARDIKAERRRGEERVRDGTNQGNALSSAAS